MRQSGDLSSDLFAFVDRIILHLAKRDNLTFPVPLVPASASTTEFHITQGSFKPSDPLLTSQGVIARAVR